MLQRLKALLYHTQVLAKAKFVLSLFIVVALILLAFFALIAAYTDQTIGPKDQ